MLKLAAFDLDGTIGDTIAMCILAVRKAVSPHARHELSEEEVVQTFGLNEEGMIRKMVGEGWKEALEDFYGAYERMHDLCPAPFDGMRELIMELRANGIPVVLITGKGERSCAITLSRFGMDFYFDRVETGSPEKNRKSEALRDVLEEFHVLPEDSIYVGDALSDITACREVGVPCLSAAWAVPAEIILRQEEMNPGMVLHSIKELRDRLIALLLK